MESVISATIEHYGTHPYHLLRILAGTKIFSDDMSVSDIHLRLKKVIDRRFTQKRASAELAAVTNVSAAMWNHVYHGRTKPSAEHLEHICRLFPEYTLWIMTGKAAPEAGQTSPDIEQLEELKKAVNE